MEVLASTASERAETGEGLKHLADYEETKGWLDQSFAWVIPTAGDMVHWDVVDSWDMVDFPMNQARTGRLRTRNMEVAEAYNFLFRLCTDKEFCLKHYNPEYTELIQGTRFVWTVEHDNVQPTNAITGLMAAIYTCPDCGATISDLNEWLCQNGHKGYDAVSGLYFTKGVPPRPMAYGDPANGPEDFRPRSVQDAVRDKKVIEVNGIGMGCAVYRKDLFRKVSEPWFSTRQGNNLTGEGSGTQDLVFCRKAKEEAGARFGVHCGVRVGHINLKTGVRY